MNKVTMSGVIGINELVDLMTEECFNIDSQIVVDVIKQSGEGVYEFKFDGEGCFAVEKNDEYMSVEELITEGYGSVEQYITDVQQNDGVLLSEEEVVNAFNQMYNHHVDDFVLDKNYLKCVRYASPPRPWSNCIRSYEERYSLFINVKV